MKKQSAIYLSILAITILLLGATSCKKKTTTPSMGTFYFHIHTDIDTNEVENATELYNDGTGRHFGLSVAQFYISNITLHNVNGSSYTFPAACVIKSIDSEEYLIGQAPAGTYDYVTFSVGLNAATNAMTPTSFTNTGYVANSAMWYGNTTQGYMFMEVQGKADTTAAQTGTNLMPFSYEIGSAANLKTVAMPSRGTGGPTALPVHPLYVLLSGGTQYIHLNCDYAKLLSGVNFKSQDSTDTYTLNPTLATTIANNIPNIFSYEE